MNRRKDFNKACVVTVIWNWACHFTYDCSTEFITFWHIA